MIDLFGFILPDLNLPNGKSNAKWLNSVQVREIFCRLTNAALSRFKWIGLPETCNERILEITLFFYGKALFFKDDNLGFAHTPVNLVGPYNIYYESINREAWSFQYSKRYDISNSVIVRANLTMTPDYLIPWVYAPKIADGIRAADVHSQTLKSPFGISCSEENKQSAIRALKKIEDNEVAVFGNKYAEKTPYEVLNFVSTCWLPEMWANVKNYLEQAYTSLGIENTFSTKKERLVTSESEGQQNPTRHIIESELKCRQQACEEINRMFGLNISVELNEVKGFMEENMMKEGIIELGGELDVPTHGV